MSNDPNQPGKPYYPPPSSQGVPPYGQGQSYYPPPPPPPQAGQSFYPPPVGPTQSAYPPAYGVPSYGQPTPPPRKKRRLLRIILGIVALIIILIVAGIISLVVFVSHSPATDVVNGYYTAMKNQNYTQAYSYLAPGLKLRDASQASLTQDVFVQGVQQVDTQKGKVTSYTITSTNLSTNNGTNTGTYTVSVTRSGSPYDVHLVLQQYRDQWKIISFDTV